MNNTLKYVSRMVLTASLLVLSSSSFAAQGGGEGWYYMVWDTSQSPTVYMKAGSFPLTALGYNECDTSRRQEIADNDRINAGDSCFRDDYESRYSTYVNYRANEIVIKGYVDELKALNEQYSITEYQNELEDLHTRIFHQEVE